jgi:hypothetical protein
MSKPTLSKAELRAQLEAALANYRGPVTHCPPAPLPERDCEEELDLNDEGVDEAADDALPLADIPAG